MNNIISFEPKPVSTFRAFLLWLLQRDNIRISTVYIEYFYKDQGDKDPIILKFGHRSALGEKKETV